MAVSVPNSFTSYSLTKQETLLGSVLNPYQVQVIQNESAQVAENILALKFDPQNPQAFVQDDSYLKGQLSVFQLLLSKSEEAQLELEVLKNAGNS
jgi:hypothetical protein